MATVEPYVLTAMAAAHQRTLSVIQIAAEQASMDAWYAGGGVDSDEDEWNAAFWLISLAAVTAIGAATHTYMSQVNAYVGIGPPLPAADLDWFADDYAKWSLSPLGRSATLIGEGATPLESSTETAAQIRKLVSAATRNAEQVVFEQIVASPAWEVTFEFIDTRPDWLSTEGYADPAATQAQAASEGHRTRPRNSDRSAWARVPQAGACGWCRVVADRQYTDKAQKARPLGSWHTFCRCSWRRLTAAESSEWTQELVGDDWREIIDEPAQTGEPV